MATYSMVCVCFVIETTFSKYILCSSVIFRTLSNIFEAAFAKNRINKSEAVARIFFVEMVFLNILQENKTFYTENTYVRVPFFVKLLAETCDIIRNTMHRCYSVNFQKTVRTQFFKEHLW